MPDTMISSPSMPVEIAAPAPPGPTVLDGYRSPQIGKLVAARAKATASIKSIVKARTAKVESRKDGGRSYSYSYADLADVLDAVADALAEHELVLLQTTQARAGGVFLVTTLMHSSDQWIASEIRLNAIGAGPQVHGSEMTYLRRYQALAVLGLAPKTDDDGAAAQDRADQGRHRSPPRQEARQMPQERREPPRAPATPPQNPHRPPQRNPAALSSAPRGPLTSPSCTTPRGTPCTAAGRRRPLPCCSAHRRHGGSNGERCTPPNWKRWRSRIRPMPSGSNRKSPAPPNRPTRQRIPWHEREVAPFPDPPS
jgi:hypothetical protein